MSDEESSSYCHCLRMPSLLWPTLTRDSELGWRIIMRCYSEWRTIPDKQRKIYLAMLGFKPATLSQGSNPCRFFSACPVWFVTWSNTSLLNTIKMHKILSSERVTPPITPIKYITPLLGLIAKPCLVNGTITPRSAHWLQLGFKENHLVDIYWICNNNILRLCSHDTGMSWKRHFRWHGTGSKLFEAGTSTGTIWIQFLNGARQKRNYLWLCCVNTKSATLLVRFNSAQHPLSQNNYYIQFLYKNLSPSLFCV